MYASIIGQITDKTVSGLGGLIDKNNTGLRSSAINRTTTTHYTPDYRFVSSIFEAYAYPRFGLDLLGAFPHIHTN